MSGILLNTHISLVCFTSWQVPPQSMSPKLLLKSNNHASHRSNAAQASTLDQHEQAKAYQKHSRKTHRLSRMNKVHVFLKCLLQKLNNSHKTDNKHT